MYNIINNTKIKIKTNKHVCTLDIDKERIRKLEEKSEENIRNEHEET